MASRSRRIVAARTTSRTFTEWLPHWHNELGARDLRRASHKMYGEAIRSAVRHFGDVPPETITPDDVEGWKASMQERGMMTSTINAYLLRLGTFFNWLVEEKFIAVESPLLSVPWLSERDKKDPPAYDAATVARILDGAKRGTSKGRDQFTILRDQLLVSLLLDTGARASETALLELDDVLSESRQVRFRAETTKGRFERVVPYGFKTARLLTRYLVARSHHRLAFLPHLFLTKQGGMKYETVHRVVRDAGRAGGVIGVRPHLLRHTAAHLMKDAGASDEVMMSLFGWSDTKMLHRYGRSERAGRALDAYRRLGSPIDRASSGGQRKPTHANSGQQRAKRVN